MESFNFTSGVLDPRISFARVGATATRVNSSGLVEVVSQDTPRFDYDPVTLVCVGLLIEDQRINRLLQSQNLNTSPWSKTNVSVNETDGTAPDGTNTANSITDNATSGAHAVGSASVWPANQRAVLSVYVKAGTASKIYIGNSSWGRYSWFDIASQTIELNDTGFTSTIENAGNGWFRITASAVPPSWAVSISIGLYETAGTTSYIGTGKALYVWGAQLEQGADVTSYIPTTTTTATRNADDALITGANFSSFWQAVRGGVLVRALPSTVSGTRPLVQFDDGTADNIIALRGNTTNPELYIVDGGAPQAQIDAGTIAANTAYSLTGWWQTNFCAARKDSGARVEDLTATIPTVTQARLGSDGTNYLNGHLATIDYYDQFSGQIYTRRKNKAVFNVI
jgi:hypothetical protein